MSNMSHDAKRSTALVLTCSDMRLQGASNLARFLAEEPTIGPVLRDGYDLIAVPGACHGFMRGLLGERTILLDYARLLIDLHQQEWLVLVQHMDCGRYGATVEGGCNAGVLLADMVETERMLRQHFPRLHVVQAVAAVDATRTIGLDVLAEDAQR